MQVFTDAIRAAAQLPGPKMRSPLIKGVLITLAALVLFGLSLGVIVAKLFDGATLLGFDLGAASGAAAGGSVFFAMFYAFTPAAMIAISLFIDEIADAVEEKHYPELGRAKRRSIATELAIGFRYAVLAIIVNIPLLPFYFLFPPLPALVNGWLLGRQYFELVARRREGALMVVKMRWSRWFSIWIGGALFALLGMIPIINLVAPIFAGALMTHTYHRERIRRAAA